MVTKKKWKPEYTKENHYEGMPPEYAAEVGRTFVPTPGQPYSPIEKAIQQGQISKDLLPDLKISTFLDEPVVPIPPETEQLPSALVPIPDTNFMLNADYTLLFKEYQRTGGKLDVTNWITAGTPLRPEMEYEKELATLSDVYAKYPGYTKEDVPITIAELQRQFNTNPARFLEDLTFRTSPENVVRVRDMLGITEDNILSTLAPDAQNQRITDTIKSVFPDYDIESLSKLLETDIE